MIQLPRTAIISTGSISDRSQSDQRTEDTYPVSPVTGIIKGLGLITRRSCKLTLNVVPSDLRQCCKRGDFSVCLAPKSNITST